ncbi:MAG: FecR domain-containing protein [Pseudomonadota bacterium]
MTARDYRDFEGDVDAIASYWVVRLGAEDCTPEDRFAFDAWRREDPAHEAAYQKIKRGNDYLDRFMESPEFQERIELARKRTRPPLWRRASTRWVGAAAACLALVTAVSLFAPWSDLGKGDGPMIVAEAVEAYETRIGERSTVTLSDGSVVTINTNSRIEVDYTDETREITLTRGQGFFDVAKDIDRPFVVVAGEKRVMALGTVFDVRFDDANEVQVTLVEGKVQVEDVVPEVETAPIGTLSSERPAAPIRVAAIELSPGERLVARANTAPEIIETDGVEETSWRRGQLVFRERELAGVVAEMNRYSSQQLVLDADERVRALKVSGVFNNGGPPSAFVDALEAMHPLEARRSGRDELTLVWRE